MRRASLGLALLMSLPACMSKEYPSTLSAEAGSAMDMAAAPMASSAGGADFERSAEATDLDIATHEEVEDGFERDLQAGTLTAGVFDDTLNPATFAAFAREMEDSELYSIAHRFAVPWTTVTVVDRTGAPIVGAELTMRGKTLVSGTDGRVVIGGWDLGPNHGAGDGERIDAVVRHAGATQRVTVRLGDAPTKVALPVAAGPAVGAIDIALVVDATGSMGDELEYLKVEIRSIAREVARAFPQVEQRYALVVYRDEGDQYVSRHFDFTADLSTFEQRLGRQHADGGGDYPEAMDAAMVDAGALSWREGPAARVAFLIADAPPHADRAEATLVAADELRTQGVAIYPVAASGVAAQAELVMRAAAAMSGGEYLFVTDDSGVGNAHAEPHIPCYAVQPLREAMTRMIRSELAGRRVEADPKRAIRTVGRGRAGVCDVPSLTLAR